MPIVQETAPAQAWPSIPLGAWQDARETLHMWTQIVGKTRLALAPMENHWWQVPLYVTSRGLTTSAMPCGARTVTIDFDFVEHDLWVRTSDGGTRAMPLIARSVASFFEEYVAVLAALDVHVHIWPVPVEVEEPIPFPDDHTHATYDAECARRFWQALLQADRVLRGFRGRFIGKASPVHFFWGSFDLAASRFSGRRAPEHPGGAPHLADWVMREAYSHEVISAGFWPGSGPVPEAAFYTYAYPEPRGFADASVELMGAFYSRELREFVLPYEVVRTAAAPDELLLAFLQTTYAAGADGLSWDRAALERASPVAR